MRAVLSFCLIAIILFKETVEASSFQDNNSIESVSMKTLENIGKDYIDLLHHLGTDSTPYPKEKLNSLFHADCKKIVNGSLWFEEVGHVIPQLLSTKEKIGGWSIDSLAIIPAKDGRTLTLHFLVLTEKAGMWNTMVILRCNNQLLITEINEVFNSYEGSL